ncbi:MAG: hypothetical protein D3922_17255 [Candidatus Electrothrix sp. AR1]|nr:hypothetical protein [Candidatus Electrothrix sp. AR1]
MGVTARGRRFEFQRKGTKKPGYALRARPAKKKTKRGFQETNKMALACQVFSTILLTNNNEKYLIWYHRPKLNRAAMRVTGRGHGFESQSQCKEKTGHALITNPVEI